MQLERAPREAAMVLEKFEVGEEVRMRCGWRGHDSRRADVSKVGDEVPSTPATRGFERLAVPGRPTPWPEPTWMGSVPPDKAADVLVADGGREDVVLRKVLAERCHALRVVTARACGEAACPQVVEIPVDVRADRRRKIAPSGSLGRDEFFQHRHPPCRHWDGKPCSPMLEPAHNM